MNSKTHGIDAAYIRKRIFELREQKGVTEHKMSLELGHNKSYIQHIMSGRTLPSLTELLIMCDYLGVSPMQFFDVKDKTPVIINRIIAKINTLNDEGIKAVNRFIDMLDGKYKKVGETI